MRAVVLETRGRKAAVLADDGTFHITRGAYSAGDIIEFESKRNPSLRQWAAAAAAMVLLLGASASLWADRNIIACAEVSLDINPSIVYTLNKRDRVLSVRAVNDDAEAIVAQLEQSDIRFATVSDAVERTMAILEDDGYLDAEEQDYVLINVSADDDARQSRLVEAIDGAMAQTARRDTTLEYRIDRSDRKTALEAEDHGMSAGRYAAWEQESEHADSGEEPDVADFAEKPVQEIIDDRPEGAQSNDPAAQEPGSEPRPEAAEDDPASIIGSAPAAQPDNDPKPREQAAAETPVEREAPSDDNDRPGDVRASKPEQPASDQDNGSEQPVGDPPADDGQTRENPPAGSGQKRDDPTDAPGQAHDDTAQHAEANPGVIGQPAQPDMAEDSHRGGAEAEPSRPGGEHP